MLDAHDQHELEATVQQQRKDIEAMAEDGEAMQDVLGAAEEAFRLVLMFYHPEWDDAKRRAWQAITGSDEATTKVMCDHIRKVMAQLEKV